MQLRNFAGDAMKSRIFLTLTLCAWTLFTMPTAMAQSRTDLFGSPVPPGSGNRTISITPDTRHVNIEGGEIINFTVGDKTFSWSFFVASHIRSFDLNQVAPPGMLDHKVTAYIAPDPRYWGRP